MLLRAYGEVRELFEELYYWAPAESRRVEVDFLLQRGREFIALEVKSASKAPPALLVGLRAIADLPGVLRRILVYTGRYELKTADGIDVWPVESFLQALAGNSLWP